MTTSLAAIQDVAAEMAGTFELLRAVAVAEWPKVPDVDVLLYIVHINALFETDCVRRQDKWTEWVIGRWIDFNGGGFTWYGLCGAVTHIAPLPVAA